MNAKRCIAGLTLCLIVCMMILTCVEQVHAKKSTAGLDQDLSKKRGVGGSLAPPKDLDESKRPKLYQIALGISSVFVMIAVMKWL